jgi:hypothetical protein
MAIRIGRLEIGRPEREPEGAPPDPHPTVDRVELAPPEPSSSAPDLAPMRPRVPEGPPPKPKRFTWIFGASETGKTVEMNLRYARAVHGGIRRALYVDVKGTNGHMGGPVGSVAELVAAVRVRERAGQPWNLVLDASNLQPDDMAPVWTLALRLGSVLVASDEIDAWAHSGQGNKLQPEPLRRMVGHGRELGVEILTTCRQAKELHRDFRNNASRMVSFRQDDPGQAAAVAELMKRPDLAPALLRLPDLHFVQVENASGRLVRGRTWPPNTPEGSLILAGR